MRPLVAAAKGSKRRLMGLGIHKAEPDRKTGFDSLASFAGELKRFMTWEYPDVPIYVPVTQAGRFSLMQTMALSCE
eukprot:symbB.v1.2.010796.t1/scaffold710.1/size170492/7